jgi:hypothetical protein
MKEAIYIYIYFKFKYSYTYTKHYFLTSHLLSHYAFWAKWWAFFYLHQNSLLSHLWFIVWWHYELHHQSKTISIIGSAHFSHSSWEIPMKVQWFYWLSLICELLQNQSHIQFLKTKCFSNDFKEKRSALITSILNWWSLWTAAGRMWNRDTNFNMLSRFQNIMFQNTVGKIAVRIKITFTSRLCRHPIQ